MYLASFATSDALKSWISVIGHSWSWLHGWGVLPKLLLPLSLLELEIPLLPSQFVLKVGFMLSDFCIMGPLFINLTMLKLGPYPHIPKFLVGLPEMASCRSLKSITKSLCIPGDDLSWGAVSGGMSMTVWLGRAGVFWPAFSWLSASFSTYFFLFLLLALSSKDRHIGNVHTLLCWGLGIWTQLEILCQVRELGQQACPAIEFCLTCPSIWSDYDPPVPWDILPFHPCLTEVAKL